jgi:phage minor structural protein
MTPVLFDANETQFNSMGIGALADAISCLVHEARNGAFELTLEYPVDAPLYTELVEDRIIKAKANDNANMDDQLFRIYKSGKPLNGQCTFYAEHITGELAKNPITHASVTSGTAQQFGQAILANTVYPHQFTFISSDPTVATSDLSRVPASQALVGIEGSLIDRWRGELTRDNFVIREEQNRGTDTGIIIEYGKNLTDAAQEKAIDETYTSIYPFATIRDAEGNDKVIELSEKIVESPYVGNYAYGRCLPIDLSGDDVTDETSLRSKAQSYVTQNDFGKPKVSLTINFIQLWQMEEYKNVAPLEHVSLCDWVTVRFKKLGIDAKVKVIDGVFNSLVNKWTSMELGDASTEWGDTLTSSIADVSATANQAAKISGYALTQANGKNKTYFSATEPIGNLTSGDLWYKIVNGQYTEMWRYNGIGWNKILSADANDALNKAIDALTAANGKNTVYHQAAQPIAANNQDIWFRDNADGTVTIFVYQDGVWSDPTLDGVKQAQDQADAAVATADAASVQASNALNTANSASGQAATAINTANSANSAAQAAQSTASSAASQASSAWNNAQTAINNAQSAIDAYSALDLSSKNLLKGTQTFDSKYYYNSSNRWVLSSETYDGDAVGEINLPADTSLSWVSYVNVMANRHMIDCKQGDLFSASMMARVDAIGTNNGSVSIVFEEYATETGGRTHFSNTFWADTSKIGEWQRVVKEGYQIQGADTKYVSLAIMTRNGGHFYVAHPMLVKGNKVGSWQPSTEDIQFQIDNINGTLSQKVSQDSFNTLAGTVSSQATLITQNQSDVALKANKDYVDTINQTVSSQCAQITANAQAITQKADSSTVNALTGQVSTMSATLTTQANQIAARITSQDADAKYATQTALTATSNSLTSSISAVQTNLNNLQIGGTNMVKGSNFPTGDLSAWSSWGTCARSVVTINGKKYIHLSQNDTASFRGVNQKVNGIMPGKSYTVSFLAYAVTSGTSMTTGFHHLNGSTIVAQSWQNYTLSTTVTKFVFTFVATTSTIDAFNFMIGNTNSPFDVYATDIKLEQSDKDTNWSPAPEDLATQVQFSQLTQTIDGISTQVSQKVDQSTYNTYVSQTTTTLSAKLNSSTAASTYATQTSLTATSSSLQTSINAKVDTTTYNSKISQLSNDINLRVSKNDVVNQINVSTESILIAGQKVHITGQTVIDNAVIQSAMIAALDAGKITTGTLAAARIAAGTITSDKLNVTNLAAISANLGNVTAGDISGVHIHGLNIDGVNISGSNINGESITSGTINSDRIAANSITAKQIAIGDFTNLFPNPYLLYELGSYGLPNIQGEPHNDRAIRFAGRDHRAWGIQIPMVEGDQFTITADVYRQMGDLPLRGGFWELRGDQSNIDSPWHMNDPVSGIPYQQWTTVTWNHRVNDGNTRLGNPYWQIDQASDGGSTSYLIQNIRIQRRITGNLFVDGTIQGVTINGTTINGSQINGSNFYQNANGFQTWLDGNGFHQQWGNDTHAWIRNGGINVSYSPTNEYVDIIPNRINVHGEGGGNTDITGYAVYSQAFNNNSREELKTEITTLDDSIGLALVNNLDIYKFKYKSEVASGRAKYIYGGIIGDGYQLPDDFKDFADQGVNLYSSTFIGLKAIQELTTLHQQDILKIADLESRLSVAESKIASLMEAA